VTGYIVRRSLQAVLVVFCVTLFLFLLVSIEGPRIEAIAVLGPKATPRQIALFNKQQGFNLPLWDQCFRYFWHLLHGNLGQADTYNQSVASLIRERLPKTLVLVGFSTVVALIVAIPLGIIQVIRRNKPSDYVLTGLSFVFYAMPTFLLGSLLITYLGFDLHWFATSISQSQSAISFITSPRDFVMPEFTLAAVTIASFSRYMRSSMMETLTEDYIRTARAKGAAPRRVLYLHALRNALIPILTLIGLSIPAIVSGAVITESVFNYPGMGLLSVDAAYRIDVPVLLGTTVVATVAVVVGSLLADILYAIADPRIRYARR